MKMEVKEANIIIHAHVLKDPIMIYGNGMYLVDNLCIYMAQTCKIGLIARHIFAFWCHNLKTWLSPSKFINGKGPDSGPWVLHFKVRFRPPYISRLKEIKDLKAFEYCFYQTRIDFMGGNIPEISHHKDQALGLSATDMIRVMLEENITLVEMKNRYREFLPQEIWKKHKTYLQKPLLDAVDKGLANSQKDPLYVKEQFLNQVWELVSDYGSEDYIAYVDDGGKVWEVLLQINPYNKAQRGLRMQKPKNKKGKWIHICSIEDLYYISMRNDNTVELSRRNGIPQYISFRSVDEMQSFISCLDGYYRLTEKWTFNLCKELPTPSLLKLKLLRCHGPVGYQFSRQKLKEKCQFKPGAFLLRESSSCYGQLNVDICCGLEEKVFTHHIIVTENDQFKLSGEDEVFEKIPELMKHALKQLNVNEPQICITPSEYDKTRLVLCRPNNQDNERLLSQRECSCTSQCIPSNAVIFKKSEEIKSRFTNICPAFLRQSDGDMKPITVKYLNFEFAETGNIQEFLEQCSQVMLWKNEALVSALGMIVHNPLGMVLESLPLGSLDRYLHLHSQELLQVDLIEGASYLARALWYLKEQDFCHGNIRCCNVFVGKHTDNCFKLKLGDPGLPIYSTVDIPWIPPECYSDMNQCKRSSEADVWAFGTTLWEIFSYGGKPAFNNYQNMDIILEQHHLAIPLGCNEDIYKLMTECWTLDSDSRKQPQAIMRDINQTLYEVYNSRRSHSYASVNPISASPDHSSIIYSPPLVSPRNSLDDPPSVSPSHHKSSSFFKGVIRSVKSSSSSTAVPYDQVSSHYSSSSAQSTFTVESFVDINHEQTVDSLISFNTRTISNQQDNNTGLLDSGDASPWVIDIKNLTMGQTLGQGFYGEVCKATLSQWEGLKQEIVAVKRIKKSVLSEAGLRDLLREINIMKSLQHENIVEIKGLVEEPQTMLVMEYLEMGSLLAYLQMYNNISVNCLLKFASDIAQGMYYLEEKHIVHRDLASRNILVASPSHVKISDFGLAQFTENQYYHVRTERNLPIRWYSPESIKYGKFSHKSDVWSYGVTLWEMFSFGENPIIPDVSDADLLINLEKGVRLCSPVGCPQEVYRLMGDCWQLNSHTRPSFLKIHEQTEDLRDSESL